MKCVVCDKPLIVGSYPAVTCPEHADQYVIIRRQNLKLEEKKFSSAYYRQKRKPSRSVESSKTPQMFPCRYCGEKFPRTGTSTFCPQTNCYNKWMEEHGYSRDLSQVLPEELKRLHYDLNMGSPAISEWYKKNKKVLVSDYTIREMLKALQSIAAK